MEITRCEIYIFPRTIENRTFFGHPWSSVKIITLSLYICLFFPSDESDSFYYCSPPGLRTSWKSEKNENMGQLRQCRTHCTTSNQTHKRKWIVKQRLQLSFYFSQGRYSRQIENFQEAKVNQTFTPFKLRMVS